MTRGRAPRGLAAALTAVLALGPGPALAGGFCTGAKMGEEAVTREFARPMSFVAGRANGRTVLQATGEIRPGEANRLADALQRAGRVEEVWLHSPGGTSDEGVRMGRVLRRAGVATRLRTGQACISACSVAFLGGVARVVEPRSFFGIHTMTATRNTELMIGMADEMAKLSRLRRAALKQRLDPAEVDRLVSDAAGQYVRALEQAMARAAAEQARFLVEMSVSLELLTEKFEQAASGVCYLGEAGLRRFNVSNTGDAAPLPPPAAPPPPSASPEPTMAASAPLPRQDDGGTQGGTR